MIYRTTDLIIQNKYMGHKAPPNPKIRHKKSENESNHRNVTIYDILSQ